MGGEGTRIPDEARSAARSAGGQTEPGDDGQRWIKLQRDDVLRLLFSTDVPGEAAIRHKDALAFWHQLGDHLMGTGPGAAAGGLRLPDEAVEPVPDPAQDKWAESREWAIAYWREFIESGPSEETEAITVPAGTSQDRIDCLARIAGKMWGGRWELSIESADPAQMEQARAVNHHHGDEDGA